MRKLVSFVQLMASTCRLSISNSLHCVRLKVFIWILRGVGDAIFLSQICQIALKVNFDGFLLSSGGRTSGSLNKCLKNVFSQNDNE